MRGYEDRTYGDRIADVYDEWYEGARDDEATVDALARLATDKNVLELAIGTGRIALPLASRGFHVAGIDASEAMVDRLRAKPGGDRIPITMGNFRDVPVEGRFGLVYLVFNTLFALPSQDHQVRCFQNVADHLTGSGVFVIECFVPDLGRFRNHQSTVTTNVRLDEVKIDSSIHDPVRQVVTSQHMTLTEQGVTLRPVVIRYAWPAELDLMARLAGLRLLDRWSDWRQSPFTPDSGSHISIYGRYAA